MIRFCVCLLLLFAAPVPALGEQASILPCSELEFDEALRARAPDVARDTMRVSPSERGFVVAVQGNARDVDLAGAHGLEAARVLALIVAELALVEAEPEQVASSPLPALARPSPAPIPLRTRPDRAYASVDGTVVHGLRAQEGWSVDVGVGGAVALPRHLLLIARAGYWTIPSERSRATGTEVSFDALSLRAGPGVRIWKLDLGLTGVVTPYWVRGGTGYRGVLAGATLSASLWLPVWNHIRLGARAHCDLFPRRTRFLAGSESVIEVPMLAFGLGLGLAWGWK